MLLCHHSVVTVVSVMCPRLTLLPTGRSKTVSFSSNSSKNFDPLSPATELQDFLSNRLVFNRARQHSDAVTDASDCLCGLCDSDARCTFH